MCRLLGVAVLVNIGAQIVCTRADTSIGEDGVNAAIRLLCLLEQSDLLRPDSDAGLDKCEVLGSRLGGFLDVTADDGGAKREEQVDGGQADTRRTTYMEATISLIEQGRRSSFRGDMGKVSYAPVMTTTLPLRPESSSSLIKNSAMV